MEWILEETWKKIRQPIGCFSFKFFCFVLKYIHIGEKRDEQFDKDCWCKREQFKKHFS